MLRKNLRSGLGAMIAFAMASTGCAALLGIDDYQDGPGSSASSGGHGGGATGGGGTGGQGASGSGGGGVCMPGNKKECYSGPDATKGVGLCMAGESTCDESGAWGACMGEIAPAMEQCGALGDEDCDGIACSETLWSKAFGDSEVQVPESVAVDSAGNVLVTGIFTSSVNFGPTGATSLVAASAGDLFLAKLGPDGSHVWSKGFGLAQGELDVLGRVAVGVSDQVFMSGLYKTAIDLGGGALSATGNQDFFVASFDASGTHLWSNTFGLSSAAVVNALAVGPDGNPVIVGSYADGAFALGSTMYPVTSGKNAFVAKLDRATGAVIWSQSYGDVAGYPVGDQDATGVAVDSGGNIVVAGTMTTETDFGLGFSDFSPDGGKDIFVMRLGESGDHTWHTYFHGPNDETPTGVAVDSTGSAFITGWFSGSTQFDGTDFGTTKNTTGPTDTDVFVVKLNAQGKQLWMKQLGDATPQIDLVAVSFDLPLGVAVDSQDRAIVAGGFLGTIASGGVTLTSQGDLDWFALKLASDGALLWGRSAGDAASGQAVAGVAIDRASDTILLAGPSSGGLPIGPGAPLQTMGSFDAVVAKLAP